MEFKFLLFGTEVVVTGWKLFGLLGVAMFTGRWFVQMYYSRKAGKPVTPRIFWVMSMIGSCILLAYFVFSPKQDMVGVLSNLFPSFIAGYNLYLDLTHEKKAEARAAAAKAAAPAEPRKAVSVRVAAMKPAGVND